MTIETKFNVNDLVQSKYQNPTKSKHVAFFEVIEITAVNCYTTAQVFYNCRAIHADTEYDFQKREHTVLGFVPAFAKDHDYFKFREDEIKPCSQDIVDKLKEQSVL